MRSDRFLQPAARCSSVYASQGPKSSVCIVSVVSIAPVSNRNREGSAACQNDKKIHIWRILTCLICIFFHSGHGVSFCGINAHTSTLNIELYTRYYTIIHNYTHAGLHLTRISLQREGQNLIWMAWTWSDWSIWRYMESGCARLSHLGLDKAQANRFLARVIAT